MIAYQAYRRNEPSTGWTRIDVLLALYDAAIDRLRKAEIAFESGDTTAGVPLVSKAQLMVCELAAGVRIDINEEMSLNYLRLYEYIVHMLREPTVKNIRESLNLLGTLREGFEAIREEAAALERSGQLQAAENIQLVHTKA